MRDCHSRTDLPGTGAVRVWFRNLDTIISFSLFRSYIRSLLAAVTVCTYPLDLRFLAFIRLAAHLVFYARRRTRLGPTTRVTRSGKEAVSALAGQSRIVNRDAPSPPTDPLYTPADSYDAALPR